MSESFSKKYSDFPVLNRAWGNFRLFLSICLNVYAKIWKCNNKCARIGGKAKGKFNEKLRKMDF